MVKERDEIIVKLPELGNNANDYAASILKSAFGIIPVAGPLAQELLGVIIPNQRMDRVVSFIEILGSELEKLGDQLDFLTERMYENQYSSLFYKSCIASADSFSDERIEYIKNIFIYGLQQTDKEMFKAEALLSLINRVTDIELVYLRTYYLFKCDLSKARKYQEKTGLYVLTPAMSGDMSREELDNEIAKAMYLNNLVSCGLIEIEYDKKRKAKYKCATVGDLLIRTINKETAE